jgi:hypothetical protein
MIRPHCCFTCMGNPAAEQKDAAQVNGDHLDEVGWFQFQERDFRRDAGAVDQDVDLSVDRSDVLGQRLRRVVVGHVHDVGAVRAAEGLEFPRECLARFQVQVCDGYRGALAAGFPGSSLNCRNECGTGAHAGHRGQPEVRRRLPILHHPERGSTGTALQGRSPPAR